MFVKQITDGLGLPVQTTEANTPALQEASQPPLYYLMGAAATFWIDSGPIADVYKPNPQAATGEPETSGDKNIVMHGAEERFPWHGAVLAVHLIRLLSLLLGLITIAATFAIARRLIPGKPFVAFSAAAFTAFLPQFIFISASVNNDNLVTALGALALLLAIKAAGGSTTRMTVLLGIIAGLGALAKVSGLVALPLIMVALGLAARHHRSVRRFFCDAITVIAITVAIAGWWYLRNWILYGDFLGAHTMVAIFGDWPAGFGLLDLLQEQERLRWSFWAVFGGFNIIADRWVYWIYDILSALGLVGLLWLAVTTILRRFRRADHFLAQSLSGEGWLLVLVWPGMLLIAPLIWSSSTMGTLDGLVFPAIPAFTVLLAVGIAGLPIIRQRGANFLSLAVSTGLAMLAFYLPFATIVPAYALPQPIASAQAAAVPNPIDARFADQIEFRGYQIDRTAAQPGDNLKITLYWQAIGAISEDFSFFIRVYAPDGRVAGQIDSLPGRGAFATSTLAPGITYSDVYSIHLDPLAIAGVGRVAVGVYNAETASFLPAVDGQGNRIGGSVSLGSLRFITPPTNDLTSALPIHASLGGQVELIGVRLADDSLQPGATLRGTLYWRAITPITDNYTVFVHLLSAGNVIAQHDAQPLGGDFPTSSWAPGDVIADPFTIAIPNVPAGDYSLVTGMYRLSDGRRLPIDESLIDRLLDRLPFISRQQFTNDQIPLPIIHIR
jgi:4-amino-4-deoxy-L-arabinose transferase-like glycosyltransferase